MTDMTPPRMRAPQDEMVPRVMVRAVLVMLAICLGLVTWARVTDRPLESTPPRGPVIAERIVYLSGDTSGAATVLDADGAVIADLDPTAGGFIAGVDRVLARERAKTGEPLDGPVVLRLREGNRLSVYDPSTGWSAELMGFGATNTRAFARLLVHN
jgi:putative photosynthetic complex assembly protein